MQIPIFTPAVLQVSFGPAYAGLNTVGYTLKNPDGSIHKPFTQVGIVEEGNGFYHTIYVFEEIWIGYIEWATNVGSLITAREDIEVINTAVPSVGSGSILRSDTFVYDYKIGLKKQIVNGLHTIFNAQLPDKRYANIYVGWEYPLEQIHYPAIYINYAEGPIENVGVASLELGTNDNGEPIQAYHAKFQGVLNFNVLALNPEDRDNLSAILLNVIMHGRVNPALTPFYQQIEDGRFMHLQVMNDQVTPSGEQTAPVPWGNQDELIFGNRYSVRLFGDYYSSTTTGNLITIEDVELFPYRDDQPAPW